MKPAGLSMRDGGPRAIAAAGLLAAALIVAGCASPGGGTSAPVMSSQEQATRAQMRAQAKPAPAWMVGQFLGTGAGGQLTDIELTVTADGRLDGRIGSITADGQYVGNSRVLWAHGNESLVERRGDGFRLVQTKNPSNVTDYVRRGAAPSGRAAQ